MVFETLISTTKTSVDQIKATIKAAQEFIETVKESVVAMTPVQLTQLKQGKETYDALKVVISGVIQDTRAPHDINGWIKAFENFDKKWDDFAKETNALFESLSYGAQENILETFAKDKFGETIFNAGSAIKNNSADVLKGIKDFKGAVDMFSGSYRNPFEAANKIRNGVAGIVSATETMAGASEKILKSLIGLRHETPDGIPILNELSKLSSFKAVEGTLSILDTGLNGMNVYSGSRQLTQCLKTGDIAGAISSAEKMYDNIHKIVTLSRKNTAIDSGAKNIVEAVNSNRITNGLKSTWNMGATGVYAFNAFGETISSIKTKDLKGAYSSGKVLIKNVKQIADEIKHLAKGEKAGEYVSPVKALQGKSSSGTASKTSAPSGPSYTYVCSEAKLKCTFGDSISTLKVLPMRTINLYGQPMANITDHLPMVNILPFGKCRTVAYPPTGSATSANHGKLTPMPCVPGTNFDWMKGKDDLLLKGFPALLSCSVLRCIYGGTITIVFDGQNV